jgi:hypothetical protein
MELGLKEQSLRGVVRILVFTNRLHEQHIHRRMGKLSKQMNYFYEE